MVMAAIASPGSERAKDTRKRLDSCWELDLAWEKYPCVLREASFYNEHYQCH